jgi:integrase
MPFYRRCTEKGCSGKRCAHPFYFEVVVGGDRERGPSSNYTFLLPKGAALPTQVEELKSLESKIRVWVGQGRPAPDPPTVGGGPGPTGGGDRTIYQAGGDYLKGHVAKMGCKASPSQLARICRDFGQLPVARLFDRKLIREWLDEIEDETSTVNRNRHQSRWSHFISWCKGEYPGFDGPWPFYHPILNPTGIRKGTEGDGRERRLKVDPDEEALLVAYFTSLDDGGQMLGRFYCAIDAGLRRGEMLQLQRDAVLRNFRTDDGTIEPMVLKIEWGTSKVPRTRHVPVTTDRLRTFLDDRRFSLFPFGQADGTRVESFRVDWENGLLAAGIDKGHWVRPREWEYTHDGDLHWHDLRHECGSRLADRGVVPHEIMKVMGHTRLETAQKYLNAKVGNIGKKMRAAALAEGW